MLVNGPADAAGDVAKRQDEQRREIQNGDHRGTEKRAREEAQDQRGGNEQFPAGDLMAPQAHAQVGA